MTTTFKPLEGTTETEKDPRWAHVVARIGKSARCAAGARHLRSDDKRHRRSIVPSRGCNPKNVSFHDTLEGAKATGFRACKRCNPDGISHEIENAILVEKACRMIERSEETPSLASLANAVELSQSYFHRLFRGITGLTPKAYAAAHRAERVREELAKGHSVTEAMYDAGFNSSGRFYEKSQDMLGMTPTHYREGGTNEEIRFAIGQTSLGAILVASSTKGVVSILIGDDP